MPGRAANVYACSLCVCYLLCLAHCLFYPMQSSQHLCEVVTAVIPVLQKRKLRFREVCPRLHKVVEWEFESRSRAHALYCPFVFRAMVLGNPFLTNISQQECLTTQSTEAVYRLLTCILLESVALVALTKA